MRRFPLLLAPLVGLLALASSWSAAPPAVVPHSGPVPAAKPRPLSLVDVMYENVERWDGLEDPKNTLGEALHILDRGYISKIPGAPRVRFEVNENAFAFEQFRDAARQEVANPPLERLDNVTVATILERILSRVNVSSGAVWLVRSGYIEITTGTFAAAEIYGKRKRPAAEGAMLLSRPLARLDLQEVPLQRALRTLAERTSTNVVIDRRVDKESAATAVTARMVNAPVETALLLLTAQADLQVVRLDNVFVVTTREHAAALRRDHQALTEDSAPAEEKGKK